MTFEALVIGINVVALLTFFVVIFRPWRKALCLIEKKRAELDEMLEKLKKWEERNNEKDICGVDVIYSDIEL